MKSGFVSSGGIQLYYEIDGESGPPMVLVNGGPGLSHNYLQGLTALLPDVQMVFYDQRGTGRSDKAAPESYTIDASVEDLENLRRALGLESFILLGHSWGGMLAQAYILRYPQHVRKLILANTFDSVDALNQSLARMRASMPAETQAIYEKWEREGLYQGRDRYPEEYQQAVDAAYDPVMLSVPPPDYLEDVFSQLAVDVYRAMWGAESEFRITGTLTQMNTAPHLGEISVPTLVIVGAGEIVSVDQARRLADAIPNARLAVFEHSRHFPWIEEPDTFFAVVREFLREA